MASSYHRLNLPLVLVFSAAVLAGLVFLTQDRKRPEPPRAAAEPPMTREEIVRTSQDQQLKKFSLTGFDDNGKTFWNLEGDTAKIDPGQTVFLEQNVTLKLRDDTIIRTDRVRWSQDRATLRTEAEVFVENPNARIHGVGAVGRPNENFIQLNKDIRMLLAGGTEVTCSGPMKIYYSEDRMVFYRKVRVKDSKGVLSANRMDVFFDPEKKEVSRIEAEGSVVIERGTDTTRSRRAIYDPRTGSIRLEGNPEITLHKGSAGLLNGAPGN